jgi:acyl dehydratase
MYFDELAVGDTAEFSRTRTKAVVVLFAGTTGDLDHAPAVRVPARREAAA